MRKKNTNEKVGVKELLSLIPETLKRSETIDKAQKVILGLLCYKKLMLSELNNDYVYVSYAEIGRYLSMSPSVISLKIRSLEAMGFFTIEKGHKGQSNRYYNFTFETSKSRDKSISKSRDKSISINPSISISTSISTSNIHNNELLNNDNNNLNSMCNIKKTYNNDVKTPLGKVLTSYINDTHNSSMSREQECNIEKLIEMMNKRFDELRDEIEEIKRFLIPMKDDGQEAYTSPKRVSASFPSNDEILQFNEIDKSKNLEIVEVRNLNGVVDCSIEEKDDLTNRDDSTSPKGVSSSLQAEIKELKDLEEDENIHNSNDSKIDECSNESSKALEVDEILNNSKSSTIRNNPPFEKGCCSNAQNNNIHNSNDDSNIDDSTNRNNTIQGSTTTNVIDFLNSLNEATINDDDTTKEQEIDENPQICSLSPQNDSTLTTTHQEQESRLERKYEASTAILQDGSPSNNDENLEIDEKITNFTTQDVPSASDMTINDIPTDFQIERLVGAVKAKQPRIPTQEEIEAEELMYAFKSVKDCFECRTSQGSIDDMTTRRKFLNWYKECKSNQSKYKEIKDKLTNEQQEEINKLMVKVKEIIDSMTNIYGILTDPRKTKTPNELIYREQWVLQYINQNGNNQSLEDGRLDYITDEYCNLKEKETEFNKENKMTNDELIASRYYLNEIEKFINQQIS